MNAYFTDTKRKTNHLPRINITHGFIEFICSLVAFFTCDAIVKVIKIGISALCFVGFFGVIGGIESESLGMALGLLLCAIFSMIEFFTLKSIMTKNTK